MMILSQDGMVAVNSDNVAMFEVKETETIPHEVPDGNKEEEHDD